MPGMVFPQLLTPETRMDRPALDRSSTSFQSPEVADKAAGSSRYDEVARQQEQRLEQRRTQRNADRKSAEGDRQQEKQAVARQEQAAAKERRDVSGERTGKSPEESGGRGSDSDKAARSAEGSRKGSGKSGDTAKPAKDDLTDAVAEAEKGSPETGSDTDLFALFGFGNLDAQATSVQASGTVFRPTGQAGIGPAGNGPTPSHALFSALLEGSKKGGGSASELMSGLQGQALGQGLAEGAGKHSDLLNAQAATRFTGALEVAGQQLNPPGGVKGAEAQALMRSYSTSVDVPVEADEWGEKVMGKLAWLTASQMSVAEIHVTPPDLGPLDVRVQVQNDQATVTVHSPTPAVRDQLELHGHRLRDMLSEQGISLDGFDVSDSGPQGSSGETADDEADNQAGDGATGTGEEQGSVLAAGELDLSWKGEVDLYA